MFEEIDIYCERLGPEYWAEPINALSNGGFLVAAILMWFRAPHWACRSLSAILFLIGAGSFLFHTHAVVWALIADVVPIGLFILAYIWAAHHFYWRLSPRWAGVTALGFIPWAIATGPLFNALPFFEISGGYWPVATLIALEAFLLRKRLPRVAMGMGLGAAILVLSLTFRSIDMILCEQIPGGTHFLWHLLNAVMLGWMIEVLRRHLAEQPSHG